MENRRQLASEVLSVSLNAVTTESLRIHCVTHPALVFDHIVQNVCIRIIRNERDVLPVASQSAGHLHAVVGVGWSTEALLVVLNTLRKPRSETAALFHTVIIYKVWVSLNPEAHTVRSVLLDGEVTDFETTVPSLSCG